MPGRTEPEILVRRADPSEPEVRAVIAAHEAHSRAHSPEQSCHVIGADDMDRVALYVICAAGEVLGCGGLKRLGCGTVEVKSVHVREAARGRGLSRRLMGHLIAVARAAGCRSIVLETGSELCPGYEAARGLYRTLGFVACGPIPGYGPDPASCFFRLDLPGPSTTGQAGPELAG